MNIYGIPIFISLDMIKEFVTVSFPALVLTDVQFFFTFLIINCMYLWFMCKVVFPFVKWCFFFVLNRL